MRFLSKSFIPMLVILFAMPALPERPEQGSSVPKTVASKRTRDLTITIINTEGTFIGGENRFCVEFHDPATQSPVSVSKVSADFRQLVGRIVEPPIRADVRETKPGEFCGRVDLGTQYYDPSSYHLFVHYVEGGRKHSQWLFVTATSRHRK
jgi:hypothetical protein